MLNRKPGTYRTWVFGALAAVACVRVPPAAQIDSGPPLVGVAARAAADSLDGLDAAVEVKAALRRRDRRLLAVLGYAVYVPGVTHEEAQALRRRYGVRVIAGTADAQVGEEGERFNHAVHQWAARYNEALLRRLRR